MAPPVSAMLLAQGQRQGNTQISTQLRIHTHTDDNTHTNTHSVPVLNHACPSSSCTANPSLHVFLLLHIIITANQCSCVCVCACVKDRVSERAIVCVNVRACALHAILSGDSGEMKRLQGKFWGKRLLNPNIQVGTYMYAHTPPPPLHPSVSASVGGYVCACALTCKCIFAQERDF